MRRRGSTDARKQGLQEEETENPRLGHELNLHSWTSQRRLASVIAQRSQHVTRTERIWSPGQRLEGVSHTGRETIGCLLHVAGLTPIRYAHRCRVFFHEPDSTCMTIHVNFCANHAYRGRFSSGQIRMAHDSRADCNAGAIAWRRASVELSVQGHSFDAASQIWSAVVELGGVGNEMRLKVKA